MKKLTQRRTALLFICIGVVLLAMVLFITFRMTQKEHFSGPLRVRQTDVSTIQPWMTLGYVSKVYGVPLPELEKKLDLPFGTDARASITKLAAEKNETPDDFIQKIRTSVSTFQQAHPAPPK